MEDIFEGAKFGNIYSTRDGRKAVYVGTHPHETLYKHKLIVEGYEAYSLYCYAGRTNWRAESQPYDIVEKTPSITYEELKQLLNNACKWIIKNADNYVKVSAGRNFATYDHNFLASDFRKVFINEINKMKRE